MPADVPPSYGLLIFYSMLVFIDLLEFDFCDLHFISRRIRLVLFPQRFNSRTGLEYQLKKITIFYKFMIG